MWFIVFLQSADISKMSFSSLAAKGAFINDVTKLGQKMVSTYTTLGVNVQVNLEFIRVRGGANLCDVIL